MSLTAEDMWWPIHRTLALRPSPRLWAHDAINDAGSITAKELIQS